MVSPSQKKSPQLMKWHEFAKKYQEDHKLTSYTDALKQAPDSWKKYKESFAVENPNYNHQAILAAERKERLRKVAAGELPPLKNRSKKKVEEVAKVSQLSVSEKEKIDSDDEYEYVERVVTTKKRKRNDPIAVSSISSGITQPKRKRKQSNPKKIDTDVTSKTKSNLTPLPLESIRRKKGSVRKIGTGKEGPKKLSYTEPEPLSLAQDPEEDFLQEKEESEEEEEEEEESNRPTYHEDVIFI